MYKVYLALIFLVGVINFLPIIGLLSLDKINQLYGLSTADQNLAILMRHRALLFGLIGGFVFYSIYNSKYQIAAMVLAAISMLGYLCLFWSVDGSNPALAKIAQIDIAGVVLLCCAAMLKYFQKE